MVQVIVVSWSIIYGSLTLMHQKSVNVGFVFCEGGVKIAESELNDEYELHIQRNGKI
jgi:hypothetical protein